MTHNHFKIPEPKIRHKEIKDRLTNLNDIIHRFLIKSFGADWVELITLESISQYLDTKYVYTDFLKEFTFARVTKIEVVSDISFKIFVDRKEIITMLWKYFVRQSGVTLNLIFIKHEI